ncbi:hypothetical protein ACVWYG_001863 [Pedobacter sp. UYEF25]
MKINKKNLCMVGLGLALSLPFACKKGFLDQTDSTKVTEDVLFKTPVDGVRLVNAIYDTFDNVDFMTKGLWYQANFLTQDFKNYGADTFFTTYEVPTTFDPLNTVWVRSYTGIARANSAIPIVAKMLSEGVIDKALADRLTGEAYFLRGVFYYYLACNFGGVPLELKTVTDDGRHPRNTQDEVFASIASDMNTAAGLLPWKEDLPASEAGRATKGAALSYEGSALMWVKKYTEALGVFNQLNGKYQLTPKFLDVNEYNNKNGIESIFEIQFKVPAGSDQSWGHSNDSVWLSTFGMPEEVSNFGYDYADPKYFNSFEIGDTRRRATVIGPGETHPSPAIKISMYEKVIKNYTVNGVTMNTCGTVDKPWKGADGQRSGYYGVKFWRDPNVSGGYDSPNTIFGDQNAIMMRYAEVLLSKAECQFRSGDSAGALATLQIVRNRAFGGTAPALTGDVLTNILNEYRHELGGEFSTWFLYRRSGEQIKYVKDTYGITVPTGKDLMPIPQAVIGTNATITQNPGY